MFEAFSSTEPEGGVSDDIGTAVITRALENYCCFFSAHSKRFLIH